MIKAQNSVPTEESTKSLIDIMKELGVDKQVDKTNYVEIAAPNGLVDKKQMKVVKSIKSLYTY
jgi:hypothetical protein